MADIIKQKDSRQVFIDTLIELAEEDDKIILIVPDVGFNYIEEFQKRFPNRFFNFGVTETSLIVIASTLALSGFKLYIYSMINFVTFRVHEMIRNAICMHKANVKIIGVKGSEKYKFLGFSHNLLWETEELEWLEKLPGMQVFTPTLYKEEMRKKYSFESNHTENDYVRWSIYQSYFQNEHPCYIRL